MKKPLALIIDDEPDIRELLEITLIRMDIDCLSAENLQEAYSLLKKHKFDLCLTDMRLPDGNGLELVSYIQENNPQLPVAVITAHGNMESAIQALKSGAFDFLSKPVDLEILRSLVRAAIKLKKSETALVYKLIGNTSIIGATRKMISKLARSQAPVCIGGETGTGKELVARMIHEQGARSSGKFVPVNCGAIPTELMESELFGHVKGSFTGAVSDKEGLFQIAEGGTLFFDEVAELPLHMQVKLLRAIQEKAIRPVGGTSELPVDVRILSATHQDLNTLVGEGKFRQDLFYRINVIEIHVPTLRDRSEDIPLLVEHILVQIASKTGQEITNLSREAISKLQSYSFPGNIRELENILERALALTEGDVIVPEDLHLKEVSGESEPGESEPGKSEHGRQEQAETNSNSLEHQLDDVERKAILDVLEQTRWNRTAAAKKLGLSLRALRYRLEKFGLANK
ncbi:MAG: sigma-54-dependent Fis family transcriptional regulator [Proteobacteria bacterium]|nr:sigma-54-dependent Fis family transcriptional regulator [Pseudomonadota bacterium]